MLAGKRVEVTSPELIEGEDIEVILYTQKADASEDQPQQFANVMEFLHSLPPSKLTMEDWERIEQTLREEKDAWGD